MKRILIVSLVVNLALLALTAWRKPPPVPLPARELRGEIRPGRIGLGRPHAGTLAQTKPVTPWNNIENGDVRQFVANLRAAGCPEATIRDIVTLRICRAYRERLLQFETEMVLKQSGNQNMDYSEWQKLNEIKQDLRDEMRSEFESVLGEDWAVLASALSGFPIPGNDLNKILSIEKRAQLRAIDKQFRHDLDALERKRATEGLDKGEIAALRTMERQKRDALAAVLSPQELEEYLYRNSEAADYVRQTLPAAKNEAEYRATVKLALEMEMSQRLDSNQQNYGMSTDETDAERKKRGEEYARRLKELLGEDRIAQQQAEEKARADAEAGAREEQDKQRMQQQLADMAAEVGVSAEGANRFFERLKASDEVWKNKFAAMEKSLSGTSEEKQKQMETFIKTELNGLAIETMGDKGPAMIEKLIKNDH